MEDNEKFEPLDLGMLESELERESYKRRYRSVLWSTVSALIVVAAAAALLAMLFLPVLQIEGSSMTESLRDGDVVVALNGKQFDAGDVVAFYFGNDILVKRVIAGPGDWVDIDADGNVYVNEALLDEPYVAEKSRGTCDIELPYQVPDGRFFVMGDHRETSIDSRSTAVGCISRDMVLGRIIGRVWPLDGLGGID